MKCSVCGSFVELERMKFIYQDGKNIRVERTCECVSGHKFQAKSRKGPDKKKWTFILNLKKKRRSL